MTEGKISLPTDRSESDRLDLFRSVMNSLDTVVYVTDPDTLEIVYANNYTVSKYGECIGKRCWEALTDLKNGPCPHCPMDAIDMTGDGAAVHVHEYLSPLDGRWYNCRDQLVQWSGDRLMKLQIAFDITDLKVGLERAREAELRFEALADASLEAIFLSEKGLCIGQNLAAREMFGYSDSEALGRMGTEWIAPEDRKTVLERMMSDNEDPYFVSALRRDGSKFPCRIHARKAEFGGRSIRITVLRNISQELEKEAALRNGEEKYRNMSSLFRLMTDNMQDMLWAKDMEKRYIFVNRAICQGLLGTDDTGEPLGRTDGYFAERERDGHPEDPGWHTFGEICSDSDSIVMESGVAERFEEPCNVRGEFIILDVNKAPIFDETGTMLGTVGSGRVVTEQKRLEMERKETLEALRRSRTFLADAQSLAGMGSWTRDRVTGWRTWSDQMFKLTGLNRGTELDDATVDSTIHPEDIVGFRDAVAIAEAQVRTIVDHEFRLLLPDGSIKLVHCRIRIEYDSYSKPLRHFGILHDITRQKELSEEKLELERRVLHAQKLESLGVLAGGIAHDFNNLLMGILGNADLALHDTPPGTQLHDRLTEMIRSSSHAAELTRQMLEYSGTGRCVRRSVDLDELLGEMRDLLRTSVSRSVEIEYRLSGDLPRMVADPTQISQVIMNLITNAAESYEDKTGTVLLATGDICLDEGMILQTEQTSWKSVDSPPPPGRYVLLEVADSGKGMLPEVRDRIFDPFFSTKFAGRGLGMAVLVGIVRGHGGMVSVQSEPGAGSAFTVYFPVSDEPDEEVLELAVAVSQTPRGRTILVVDDEEPVLNVVSSMLERAGFQVICTSNGEEAVEIYSLRHSEISCVILDMTMPRMSGEECFSCLRSIRPDVRVLVSSGYEREDVTGRFSRDALAGFIQKPYRYADLIAALASALREPE